MGGMAINWDKELEEIRADVDARWAELLARIRASIAQIHRQKVALLPTAREALWGSEAQRNLLESFREFGRKRRAGPGAGAPPVTGQEI